SGQRLRGPNELLAEPASVDADTTVKDQIGKARRRLEQALRLLNTAIAQTRLLSGDVLIPIVDELLLQCQHQKRLIGHPQCIPGGPASKVRLYRCGPGEPAVDPQPYVRLSFDLLGHNRILGANWVTYHMIRRFAEHAQRVGLSDRVALENEIERYG